MKAEKPTFYVTIPVTYKVRAKDCSDAEHKAMDAVDRSALTHGVESVIYSLNAQSPVARPYRAVDRYALFDRLTASDWTEIFYALEFKRHHSAAVTGDHKWERQLDDILRLIGPDGERMVHSRKAA